MTSMDTPAPLTLPTALFPPLSWYAALVSAPSVQIEVHETFPKQTYRNRFEILTSQGVLTLVAPVSRPMGNHTPTAEIVLNYRESWPRVHFGAIKAAYGSSPYFGFYMEIIARIFECREDRLVDFNKLIINELNQILGITPEITQTKEYQATGCAPDYRKDFKPGRIAVSSPLPAYPQVFSHKTGFIANLSILDLIFNLGPDALAYLKQVRPGANG